MPANSLWDTGTTVEAFIRTRDARSSRSISRPVEYEPDCRNSAQKDRRYLADVVRPHDILFLPSLRLARFEISGRNGSGQPDVGERAGGKMSQCNDRRSHGDSLDCFWTAVSVIEFECTEADLQEPAVPMLRLVQPQQRRAAGLR